MTGTYLAHLALWLAALALIAGGLAATIVPGIPGVLVIYAGMWLAAWTDHFARVGWPTLTILGVLAAVAVLADLVASTLGAQRAGASRAALVGSVIGGLVGLAAGLPGLLLGPFVGAVLGELMVRRPLGAAARAGFGTWVGLIFGTLAKLALAISMLAVFVAAYLL